MSFEAMLWAVNRKLARPAQKLTLILLADRSGSESIAWPSVAWLSDKTGLDRKTVISALDALERDGSISDTGKRKSGVKVYRLNMSGTHNFGSFDDTVPKTGQFQNSDNEVPLLDESSTVFPSRSTTFPYKQYQKRDTEPVRNHIEPVKEPICATRFDEFWKLYPNGAAKKKCLEMWKKRNYDAIAETILDDVRRKSNTEAWTKQGGKFVPMSSTYLSQERWNDKPQQEAQQTRTRGAVF